MTDNFLGYEEWVKLLISDEQAAFDNIKHSYTPNYFGHLFTLKSKNVVLNGAILKELESKKQKILKCTLKQSFKDFMSCYGISMDLINPSFCMETNMCMIYNNHKDAIMDYFLLFLGKNSPAAKWYDNTTLERQLFCLVMELCLLTFPRRIKQNVILCPLSEITDTNEFKKISNLPLSKQEAIDVLMEITEDGKLIETYMEHTTLCYFTTTFNFCKLLVPTMLTEFLILYDHPMTKDIIKQDKSIQSVDDMIYSFVKEFTANFLLKHHNSYKQYAAA